MGLPSVEAGRQEIRIDFDHKSVYLEYPIYKRKESGPSIQFLSPYSGSSNTTSLLCELNKLNNDKTNFAPCQNGVTSLMSSYWLECHVKLL